MLAAWMTSVRPASATFPFSSQERFPDACVFFPALCGPALPGYIRIAVGDRRADRQPARPGGRPVAIAVAACRLTAGGVLIVCYLTGTRRPRPSGRAAWARITVIGLLAAIFQSCYFAAVSLTSVPLATLITIGAAPVIVLGAERAIGRPLAGSPSSPPGWP